MQLLLCCASSAFWWENFCRQQNYDRREKIHPLPDKSALPNWNLMPIKKSVIGSGAIKGKTVQHPRVDTFPRRAYLPYPAILPYTLYYYTILHVYYILLSSYLKMGEPAVAIPLLADKPNSEAVHTSSMWSLRAIRVRCNFCCVVPVLLFGGKIFVANKIMIEGKKSTHCPIKVLYLIETWCQLRKVW